MNQRFSADDPIIWRGPKKNAVIRQFLEDVLWGELDYLIVDTPPGTSDEHISTCELLIGAAKAPRALLVTTPQSVALADVRKEAAFCRQMSLPVIGIVENMSGYVCTHCKECTNIFSSDGGRLLAEELRVPFAGRVPIDPSVAACEDQGKNFFVEHPESETLQAILDVADQLISKTTTNDQSGAV
jgi:Mrp family chromosome partitioning ATPase